MPSRKLPETMISSHTGETLLHGTRPFIVAFKGAVVTVDLPGYYPAVAGEGIHIGADMSVVDEALRTIRKRANELQGKAS